MKSNSPIVVAVAPNGSNKTKQDHPNIPLTAEELAVEARNCVELGATILNLEVCDDKGNHSLDPSVYRSAIKTIRKAVGNNVIIQISADNSELFSINQYANLIKKGEVHKQISLDAVNKLNLIYLYWSNRFHDEKNNFFFFNKYVIVRS